MERSDCGQGQGDFMEVHDVAMGPGTEREWGTPEREPRRGWTGRSRIRRPEAKERWGYARGVPSSVWFEMGSLQHFICSVEGAFLKLGSTWNLLLFISKCTFLGAFKYIRNIFLILHYHHRPPPRELSSSCKTEILYPLNNKPSFPPSFWWPVFHFLSLWIHLSWAPRISAIIQFLPFLCLACFP